MWTALFSIFVVLCKNWNIFFTLKKKVLYIYNNIMKNNGCCHSWYINNSNRLNRLIIQYSLLWNNKQVNKKWPKHLIKLRMKANKLYKQTLQDLRGCRREGGWVWGCSYETYRMGNIRAQGKCLSLCSTATCFACLDISSGSKSEENRRWTGTFIFNLLLSFCLKFISKANTVLLHQICIQGYKHWHNHTSVFQTQN